MIIPSNLCHQWAILSSSSLSSSFPLSVLSTPSPSGLSARRNGDCAPQRAQNDIQSFFLRPSSPTCLRGRKWVIAHWWVFSDAARSVPTGGCSVLVLVFVFVLVFLLSCHVLYALHGFEFLHQLLQSAGVVYHHGKVAEEYTVV